VEDGYVEEVASGEFEDAFDKLVRRYRKLEELVNIRRQGPDPSEKRVPPDKRLEILSGKLAKEAAQPGFPRWTDSEIGIHVITRNIMLII